MRIAILHPFYPSTILSVELIKKHGLKRGHPYPWVIHLAEAIVENGKHEVHIITTCSEFKENQSFLHNGVVYDFVHPSNKYIRGFTLFEADKWKINKFIKSKNFDIIHGQGFDMHGYWAVIAKPPSILTLHLFNRRPIKNYFANRQFSLMGLYNAFIKAFHQQVIIKKVKNIIFISEFQKIKLLDEGLKLNMYHIENAISPVFFKDHDYQDDSFVLYIGSIIERKSLLSLVKAAQSFSKIKVKIISHTIKGRYFSKVQKFIEENNLNNNFEFLGPKGNDEVVEIMRRCSFVILPSKKEGAPMVISEAMAVGKPVIASKVDGIPFMIKEGETGFLFEVGDIETLSARITYLLDNPDISKKMGEKAKKEAIQRWNRDVVAHKTMKAYQNVLSREQQS